MTRILLALIAFYRRWLSPALHTLGTGGCKYLPTCSEFGMTAIAVHGPVKGSWLTVKRILRCHPFARGGFDPVPGTYAPGAADGVGYPETHARATSFPHEPLP